MNNGAGLRVDGWAAATLACPKQMDHGPCGGVADAGTCEVPAFGDCSFLAVVAEDWPYDPAVVLADLDGRELNGAPRYPAPAQQTLLATAAVRALVITDLPAAALSAESLLATAEELRGAADAVLLGDHGGARVQFPPSYRAKLLLDRGHAVWAGINCRDRNRVAIEGEIAACVDAGVAGIHCVTGDHTALGLRPDAQPVFDLDGVDVTALARAAGALVSVAHAPAAPPVEQRLPRLLAKVVAGAEIVFIDHCGGPVEMAAAVQALRLSGFTGLVLACVPVVTSLASAAVIESFAAGRLPADYIAGILAAPDPEIAGVVAATRLAWQLLEIPGVDGVNLSTGAGPGEEISAARALARVGRRLIGTAPVSPSTPSANPTPEETA